MNCMLDHVLVFCCCCRFNLHRKIPFAVIPQGKLSRSCKIALVLRVADAIFSNGLHMFRRERRSKVTVSSWFMARTFGFASYLLNDAQFLNLNVSKYFLFFYLYNNRVFTIHEAQPMTLCVYMKLGR